MAAINIKGQIWNGPIAKIYRHEMFSQQTKFHAFIIKRAIFFTSQPNKWLFSTL